MRGFIEYFYRYAIAADLLMISLLIGGVVSMGKVTSTFFPEVKSKIINIQIVYPGASPEEIEEGIVIKIEDNLKGVAGIDQVTSVSSENAASIIVETAHANETDEILQDVKNAVDRISSFPTGMEPPIIYKRDQIDLAISFAVNGDADLATLKRIARKVEDDLREVEGISQVELNGFPDEEIEVTLSEDKMRSLNLSFIEVAAALRNSNIETTGGKIRGENEELLIRGRFKEYYARDLGDIVVRATDDGRVIRLADIAEVKDKWSEDAPSRNTFNGKPAVVVNVSNLVGENLLFITDHVKNYIDSWNEAGNEVRLDIIDDRSVVLQQRIDLLANNGIIGFILVVIILALFLNIRLAFWVALAIPVSFAGMFIIANMIGITINVVTLFGMILVIGILVDDGIVIAENIYSQYEKGKSRYQAAIDGTMEVLPAVFSAIFTTIIAFSAFYFVEGRLGDFFSEMATIVIFTLIFSLVEGALILPAHIGHSKALNRDNKPTWIERHMRQFMDFMRFKTYAPVLKFVMKNGLFTFLVIVGIFILTVVGGLGGGLVKSTFFPFIEADNISVTLKLTSGTRESITQSTLDMIEEKVWVVNEELKAERADGLDVVLGVDKRLGPTSYDGTINIILLDGETRNQRILEITDLIRTKVGPVYGAEAVSYGVASPFGRAISVSLLGNNLDELSSALEEVKAEMEQLSEIKDVIDNNQEGLQEVNVKLKPKAYNLGLTVQEVLSQLRQGFFGLEVQRLQRGIDEVKVWLRYSEVDRSSIGRLETIRIRAANGEMYPLNELADLEIKRGIVAINHLNGAREMQLSADVSNAGVSASDVMTGIREFVPGILSKYPSVKASFEGQNRERLKSQNSIQTVMPLVFILMLLVIIMTFRSIWQGLAVFLLIPFGFIGVVFGHGVHGVQMSFFSVLGIIALIGILVNDALVFVSAYNSNLKTGMTVPEAIMETGLSRFRPILLTSITTVAGLAPLILNKSFQAQFLIPMALAVAYGLLVATLLILVLLPVYLLAVNRLRRNIQWLRTGVMPSPEEVEPAVQEVMAMRAELEEGLNESNHE